MITSIFIVDDDKSFGRSLKRLLNTSGKAAGCFESARALLDSVPSGQKGIAVAHIHIPDCDGFGLMDKMHNMNYQISEGKLSFGPLLSTRMACPEDSLDALFMRDLQRVTSFFIEDGFLYLELLLDSGTMKFKAAP